MCLLNWPSPSKKQHYKQTEQPKPVIQGENLTKG